MKKTLFFCAIFSYQFFLGNLASANKPDESTRVSVAILATNQKQMQPIAELFERFNRSQSKILVEVDFYSDKTHKSKIAAWLERGDYDLIHWQGGKRLDDFVNHELLQPINTIIDAANLRKNVNSQLLEVVEQKGSLQALPFGYYPWGFYYSKPIFAKYSLSPPKSWKEFIAICKLLKEQNISPLVQANEAGWPLLSWIDFLSLGLGGIEGRLAAIEYAGLKRSEVDNLTTQFNELLSNEFFLGPRDVWRWEQTLPLLQREFVAMTLMGQFAESEIGPEQSDDIGYFPFPNSTGRSESISVAPIDLFVVPLASNKKRFLSPLLTFLMQPSNNQVLATSLGFLPVHPDYDGQGLSQRAQIGLQQLRQSSKLVQYFDRDADAIYAENLAASIADSIKNGEVFALKSALLGEESVSRTTQVPVPVQRQKVLNISSLTGARGTFFVSNVLESVYNKLGYTLSVSRYNQLQENLNSYQSGADGELVRAASFSQQSADLLQVPEPISESTLYLVCHKNDECSDTLPSTAVVGNSIDIVVLDDWWKRQPVTKQDFASTALMLDEYLSGQLNFMILSAVEVSAFQQQLGASSFRTILKQPFYHFLHKKHANILDDVNRELIKFKLTDKYKELRQRYWLN